MRKQFLAAALMLLTVACTDKIEQTDDSEKKETEIVTPSEPSADVPIKLGSLKQTLSYTYDEGSDTYTITQSGNDPFVGTQRFGKNLPDDIGVLTFDYTASRNINNFKIYFLEPASEGRSSTFGALPASAAFRTVSFNLMADRDKHNWGYASNYMRLDFGDDGDNTNTIQIRNMRMRTMTEKEKQDYEATVGKQTGNTAIARRIKEYLEKSYSGSISSVSVSDSEITISGSAPEASGYSLAEIAPYEDITEMESFPNATPLTSKSFSVKLPRKVSKDGFTYDRLLSKWALVNGSALASHARYADEFDVANAPAKAVPSTKKGLGGYFGESTQQVDLSDLAITSVTVNVVINTMINTVKTGNFTTEYNYGGKTYYISTSAQTSYDAIMRQCANKGIIVSVIILNRPGDSTASTAIMKHPENNGGNYSIQNLTTAESVNLFAAVIDYMASRYNGGSRGRIHHWIIHNEVDFASEWTNMGDQPEMRYIDTYIKVMRVCGLIARKYDPNASPLISLTHCWNSADGQYAPKDLLEDLNKFSAAEGDFRWGVAYHPYPQNLALPAFWKNDTKSTYSLNSDYCTFKNLEVINAWILKSENMYKKSEKRILFLSENGTNSPSYSDSDLALQAAGAAWALKKVYALSGIDAIQWHNWRDNKDEGLRIGLRRFPDDSTDPSGKKPVWYVYQAAGSSSESAVFDPYLPTLGLSSWDGLIQNVN